jgi:4-aminobutyrate aminotransferase/(S)-3-amino-2-methylpropionate transaminase
LGERLSETAYHGVWHIEAGKCEYADFSIEPIQASGGYPIPPQNYFSELEKVLDRYGLLPVVDEIQMGIYRTGKMWAIEHFGVTPDVIVFGKAPTNGLNPLSGLWAREELINPQIFPTRLNTFHLRQQSNGNRRSARDYKNAGRRRPGKRGYGKRCLSPRAAPAVTKKYRIIGDVDGLGLAPRIEICAEAGFIPNKAATDRLIEEVMKGDLDVGGGKRGGLVLDVGGYYKHVITLAPALTITRNEIDLAARLFDQLFVRLI